MHAQQRRLDVLQQHLLSISNSGLHLERRHCKAQTSHPDHKVSTAEAAVALIPDKAVVTVSIRQCCAGYAICFHMSA